MTASTEGMEARWFSILLGCLCGLAVLSNALILLVVALNKTLRGVTEMFIANLALSDMILAGVAMPLKLNQGLSQSHDFLGGNVACKLVMSLPILTICASIYTMLVISFDRYFTIVRGRHLTTARAALVLVLIWVWAFVMTAPQFYEYSIYTKEDVENGKVKYEIACGSHGIAENFETVYASFVVALCYVTPLLIVCVNYVSVGRFLWRASCTAVQGAVSRQRVRVVQMLAAVTVVFALLWLPYFVLFTMEEVTGMDDSSDASSLVHSFKTLLVVFSTLSNILLYAAFNAKFRGGMLRVISCGRHRGNSVSDVSKSNVVSSQETKSTTQGMQTKPNASESI